ncbi:mycoredoxin [Psychromicrobium xiongbiense]|uniref:mycoredoxin n=1 Tax=Psychromicrobium xiongbiense TaxID=3051184 RepID=UPI002554F2FA|nr:mycoredoxin [Psychromicrobium sp. YIM S02556]
MTTKITTAEYTPAAGSITMFSTSWCGYCRRLKTQLDSQGIGYTEVNIEEVPGTAALVEQLNDGNQTVPTVIFPDGSAATNPSLADVKGKLAV